MGVAGEDGAVIRGNVRMVHQLLHRAAEGHAERPAVVDGRLAWTYADLRRHSLWTASRLASRGVGPSKRVVVEAAPDRRTAALLFACSQLGATAVPVHPQAPPYQLTHVLRDARPAVVVASEGGALRRLTGSNSATFGELVCEEPPDSGMAPPAQASDGGGPAFLIYTSGSTALPKGVVCPQRAVLFAARAISARLQYRCDDVVWCRLPLAFDYGLYQLLLCVSAGACLRLVDGQRDTLAVRDIVSSRATVLPLVPTLANMLVALAAREGPVAGVRAITSTGEEMPVPLRRGLRQAFPDAVLHLMYGTTECKRVSVMQADGDLKRPRSVGRPLAGTRVRILDAAGREAPTGATGEIAVAGPHVMAGYRGDPALTERTFRQGRDGTVWLFTGDLGHTDGQGYLYLDGRKDDVFKQNGLRTSVREIEAAALDIPGVEAAVAVPPTDALPAALFASGPVDTPQLARQLSERLGPGKVPRLVRHVDRMPCTPNGKIDRQALLRMVEGRS